MEGDTVKEKKRLCWLLPVVILLLAAVGWFFWKYTFVDGTVTARSADTIDLRGREISEEKLRTIESRFPDAHILWDVTVGGKSFDGESESIVTADFTTEDIPSFARLKNLKEADVSACSDFSAILALQNTLPEVRVHWTVPLGEKSFDGESESIAVQDASADMLRAAITRLPKLRTLVLTDSTLSPADQLALTEEFPSMLFSWDVTLAGRTIPSDVTALDFTGTPLTEEDLSELSAALPLFSNAESVKLTDCGLSEHMLRDFSAAHPNLLTEWETQLFGVRFSTAAEEIDFSDVPLTVEDAAQIETMLPYLPKLKKVVMLRCGISDEDMDAIDLRHEDVQFVWMVQVRRWGLRTDRTYFTVYNNDYEFPEDNHSFAALRYCRDMIAIDLGHQKFYDDPDMFENFPDLRYLVVSNSQYESLPALKYLKNLVMLEMFWTNTSDITPLRELTNLRHLNITYKRVRDAEADLDTLMHMTWLERLWISYNMYRDDQIEALKAALPDTQVQVIYTTDCVSQGWRNGSEEYFNMRDALHMYYLDDDSNHVYINPYTNQPSQYDDTDPFR